MNLEFINENIDKIIKNINDVLYIRPYNINGKIALYGVIKEDKGIYKRIKLTKEMSKLTFPFEPLYYLYENNKLNKKDFLIFNNIISLNKNNLDGFITSNLNNKIYNIGVFATFTDCSSTIITREIYNKFIKNKELNLLVQEYPSKHNNYYIIEDYKVDMDTYIIPKNDKVKKLTP